MRIDRLFSIVYQILERENVTAKELAAHFEVSLRTIYRDLDMLAQAGLPIYTQRGRGGGIRLMDGFVLNKAVLSHTERTEILSALQSLSALGLSSGAVLSKMKSFLGGADTDWIAVDFFDWSGRQEQSFAVLKEAVLQHRMVSFDYCAASGERTHRTVCPLQLWFKQRTWYLRAFCTVRKAERVFKLARIRALVLEETGFSLCGLQEKETAVLSKKEAPALLSFTMRVDSACAYRVYDEFSDEETERLPNGDFLVSPTYPQDEWVYGMILSYGAQAEIIKPESLRQEIAKRLCHAASKYFE
ncbi:MAG: YafY family protein [Oscillospiraceae bacterium]|nr:YafY family transcriptional regulator [Oscillospiraceae bacterium]MDY3065888.1 YafY family protein [Oscillospiraceae bacterium]